MKEEIKKHKRDYHTPIAEWLECVEDDFIAISGQRGDTGSTSTGGGNTGFSKGTRLENIFELEEPEEIENPEDDEFQYNIPEVF